jgi:hypothetical protein
VQIGPSEPGTRRRSPRQGAKQSSGMRSLARLHVGRHLGLVHPYRAPRPNSRSGRWTEGVRIRSEPRVEGSRVDPPTVGPGRWARTQRSDGLCCRDLSFVTASLRLFSNVWASLSARSRRIVASVRTPCSSGGLVPAFMDAPFSWREESGASSFGSWRAADPASRSDGFRVLDSPFSVQWITTTWWLTMRPRPRPRPLPTVTIPA